MDIYNVSELSEFIKLLLPNKKIKVKGEVSQPKLSNGHIYFSLKDSSCNLKSIIWKSKNINRDLIVEGQELTIECKLDYYGGNGSINLVVDKIIADTGPGDLFIKYEKMKQDFINKGYFDDYHKLEIPQQLNNILIITSENGAAIEDFLINLKNNKSNIKYDILDVQVQGVDCPKNICQILKELQSENIYYDLVVITRGGGSFADLFGFSQPELIETVYNFHLPVLSAIGHQIDNPLLDLVADITTPTPSLASQFIIEHNKKYIQSLQQIRNKLKNKLIETITCEHYNYLKFNDKLYKIFNTLTTLKNQCQNQLIDNIKQVTIKLSVLKSKLLFENNTISLYHNNDKIQNNEELDLYINKIIKLRWGEKEYKIQICI